MNLLNKIIVSTILVVSSIILLRKKNFRYLNVAGFKKVIDRKSEPALEMTYLD